ncbi:MAG: hypothetical protein JXQ27_18620 [Acidobacteria bacterium]|nr:hypothetical protein [Acidobacteriota bacterium]
MDADVFRPSSPDQEAVMRRAEELDPELFIREGEEQALSAVIEEIISAKDLHPPRLDKQNPLAGWTETYYTYHGVATRRRAVRGIRDSILTPPGSSADTGHKHVLDCQNVRKWRLHTKVLDKIIRYILDCFGSLTDVGGDPLRMHIGRHFLVEHSLHAAQILCALVQPVCLGAVLAALGHDLVEDYFLASDRPDAEWQLAAYPPNWQTVLESANKRLLAKFCVDDETVNLEIVRGVEAVIKLTRNPLMDYEMDFQMAIAREPELGMFTAGYDTLVTELSQERERLVAYAVMAKAADKISGLLTIAPNFEYRRKLKLYGKSWLVLNQVKKLAGQRSTGRSPRIFVMLADQMAIELRRQLRRELERVRKLLPKLYKAGGWSPPEDPLGLDIRTRNEYIRSGDFFRQDSAETDILRRSRDYARTIYSLILLGSKLRPDFAINPGLMRREEDGREALNRLRREQRAFVAELPERRPSDAEIESLVKNQAGALLEQFHRLSRRLLILDSLMELYILNESFFLDSATMGR